MTDAVCGVSLNAVILCGNVRNRFVLSDVVGFSPKRVSQRGLVRRNLCMEQLPSHYCLSETYYRPFTLFMLDLLRSAFPTLRYVPISIITTMETSILLFAIEESMFGQDLYDWTNEDQRLISYLQADPLPGTVPQARDPPALSALGDSS